ncbi:hypothetical protein [Helicobacter cinaedi]|uniref:hypothetical protein n=1 Tax=Helicobacter cinaedi TaxID=213 RepID=UPI0014028EFB|nr:hypothetical protein [Helicobacter cinaedi]
MSLKCAWHNENPPLQSSTDSYLHFVPFLARLTATPPAFALRLSPMNYTHSRRAV